MDNWRTRPRVMKKTEHGSTPFGERLKQERIRRGLTVKQLAEEAGVHWNQLTRMENQGAKPTYYTFVAIAEVLDCSLDYLAGLERETV